MAALIQHRRGTAAQWAASNPVLSAGEIGYDTTSKVIKIGDGTTAWNALSSYLLADVQAVLDAQTSYVTGQLNVQSYEVDSTIATELATVPSRVSTALAADSTVATAASNAAVTAVNARVASETLVKGGYELASESGLARAWVDLAGREALTITVEGAVGFHSLTETTVTKLKTILDLKFESIPAESGYSKVWVDLAGRNAFYVDTAGAFGFSKLDSKTLAYLSTTLVPVSITSPKLFNTNASERIRSIAAGPDIMMWGDSLTASGGIETKLATLTSRTIRNGGVGGENSYTIAARMGVSPFMMTVSGNTIPADLTPVDVTFTIDFPGATGKPFLQGTGVRGVEDSNFYGKLAGVRGRFYLRTKDPAVAYPSGSALDVYSFVRTTAGTAVTLTKPMPFVPEYAFDRANDIQIIWIGQNGPTETDNTQLYRQIIQNMQAPLKRYILASRTGFSNVAWSTEELNLQREFGRRYINIRWYLLNYALVDLGITPTAQDVTDQGNGTIPTSLRTDSVHHTQLAQQAVAEFLVYPRLLELGYI